MRGQHVVAVISFSVLILVLLAGVWVSSSHRGGMLREAAHDAITAPSQQ